MSQDVLISVKSYEHLTRSCRNSLMSTHSPHNTIQSTHVVQRTGFDHYRPASDDIGEEGLAKAEIQELPSPPPKSSHLEGITNFYGAVSRMFGFNEKYSLGLCACKTSITFMSAHSPCSDFLWGCSYRILSRTDLDDEPSECAQLDHSRWAPSNMCDLSCRIITTRLLRGVVLVQAKLV
jgi:hypothetical protein